jgi:circadian clock protein KaiC
VFIDAITDVERLTLYPRRLPLYLAAFTNELRARDITTLLAAEANGVVGAGLEIPLPAVSATVENILVLRYVELRSQLHRLVSVLKVRQSAYDTAIREFVITERGMQVADTFATAEAVLTGVGHVRVPEPHERPGAPSSTSTPT